MQVFCTKTHYLKNSRGSGILKICATERRLIPKRINVIHFQEEFCLEEDRLEAFNKLKITHLFKDIDLLIWGMGNLNQYHFLKILSVVIGFFSVYGKKMIIFFSGKNCWMKIQQPAI